MTIMDYLYLLTQEGMKAKLRLTRAYLDRKGGRIRGPKA